MVAGRLRGDTGGGGGLAEAEIGEGCAVRRPRAALAGGPAGGGCGGGGAGLPGGFELRHGGSPFPLLPSLRCNLFRQARLLQ
jgi:hypothetical protein